MILSRAILRLLRQREIFAVADSVTAAAAQIPEFVLFNKGTAGRNFLVWSAAYSNSTADEHVLAIIAADPALGAGATPQALVPPGRGSDATWERGTPGAATAGSAIADVLTASNTPRELLDRVPIVLQPGFGLVLHSVTAGAQTLTAQFVWAELMRDELEALDIDIEVEA